MIEAKGGTSRDSQNSLTWKVCTMILYKWSWRSTSLLLWKVNKRRSPQEAFCHRLSRVKYSAFCCRCFEAPLADFSGLLKLLQRFCLSYTWPNSLWGKVDGLHRGGSLSICAEVDCPYLYSDASHADQGKLKWNLPFFLKVKRSVSGNHHDKSSSIKSFLFIADVFWTVCTFYLLLPSL